MAVLYDLEPRVRQGTATRVGRQQEAAVRRGRPGHGEDEWAGILGNQVADGEPPARFRDAENLRAAARPVPGVRGRVPGPRATELHTFEIASRV